MASDAAAQGGGGAQTGGWLRGWAPAREGDMTASRPPILGLQLGNTLPVPHTPRGQPYSWLL